MQCKNMKDYIRFVWEKWAKKSRSCFARNASRKPHDTSVKPLPRHSGLFVKSSQVCNVTPLVNGHCFYPCGAVIHVDAIRNLYNCNFWPKVPQRNKPFCAHSDKADATKLHPNPLMWKVSVMSMIAFPGLRPPGHRQKYDFLAAMPQSGEDHTIPPPFWEPLLAHRHFEWTNFKPIAVLGAQVANPAGFPACLQGGLGRLRAVGFGVRYTNLQTKRLGDLRRLT